MPRGTGAAIAGALAAGVWLAGPDDPGLRHGLALFVLIAALWMTQALPLAVTALLVPLLAAGTGLLGVRAALAPFAHPVIFLFLGGFALAAALRAQGLDRALAAAVLRLAGGRRRRAAVLLAAAAALMSMWMSNTATAAMMLPLAIGLLADGDAAVSRRERVFVLLALAYSCSIGGVATVVGSPPNAVAAAHGGIGFADWLRFGAPAALVLWLVMMGLLWLLLRPRMDGAVAIAGERLEWTRPRLLTLAIFALAVAGWIAGAPLARALGVGADIDTLVALAALALLVGLGCLPWKALEAHTQWGVLLLFGGGLALSDVMQASGASRFLAEQLLALVGGAPLLLVIAGMVLFVVFLSELFSNTAAAVLVLPIFVPAAVTLGLPPPLAAAFIGIAASCGFMLPVATPPNAIVFGTGQVTQGEMMRCGFWLNLGCAAALTALVWIAMR